jgi:hypothetical protein
VSVKDISSMSMRYKDVTEPRYVEKSAGSDVKPAELRVLQTLGVRKCIQNKKSTKTHSEVSLVLLMKSPVGSAAMLFTDMSLNHTTKRDQGWGVVAIYAMRQTYNVVRLTRVPKAEPEIDMSFMADILKVVSRVLESKTPEGSVVTALLVRVLRAVIEWTRTQAR